MKTSDFAYHRPDSIAEAVRLLSDLGDEAKLIAGGQSLLPIMNMRLAEPSDLIDISRVAELLRTDERADATIYGAASTHMMFEDGLVPDAAGGLLQAAAAGIGYRAIRNRGTLGGSLAHSDSSAEWPTVMAAVNATVTAESVRGRRDIPVRELLKGFFTTALEWDELIVAVAVSRVGPESMWGLCKTNRKTDEFAESLAVVVGAQDADGHIEQSEIWLGAARDVPIRLHATEALVAGRHPSEMSVAELLPAVVNDAGSSLDVLNAHDRHRFQLHAVTVHRALLDMRKAAFDD